MINSKELRSWQPVAALFSVGLLLVGVYVAAYLIFSTFETPLESASLGARSFESSTAATIFTPAVKIESLFRGGDLEVWSIEPVELLEEDVPEDPPIYY